MLLVDTLRADHLGRYGYDRDTSPHLDSFAETAVVFTDATAQAPWTIPSVASLLTGLYPSGHGLTAATDGRVPSLNRSVLTLAEALQRRGYRTGAFTTNPWITRATGLDRGFGTFQSMRRRGARRLNRSVLDWLRDADDRPSFAFVHYMDVHGPYDPPAPFDTCFDVDQRTARWLTDEEFDRLPAYLRRDRGTTLDEYVALYDGSVRFWDETLSELLAGLEGAGLLQDAILIVTSDHGEEFLEHGGFNHGHTLYQEQIRVPLVWKPPGPPSIGRSVSQPVELVDVAPTLAAQLGVPSWPGTGRDLTGLMRGEPAVERSVFSEGTVALGGRPHPDGVLEAVRRDTLKAIVNRVTGETQYYDLAMDPGEHAPLRFVPESRQALLQGQLDAWTSANRQLSRRMSATGVPLNDERRRELEALGYVDTEAPSR